MIEMLGILKPQYDQKIENLPSPLFYCALILLVDGKHVCLRVVQLVEVFGEVFLLQDEVKTLLSVEADFLIVFVFDSLFWNLGHLSFYFSLLPWTSYWI